MKLDLNLNSPVPLYHQISEAIRYAIATGKLANGQSLLPVREAAERWGVNLHTVRRAYAELAKLGLVETRPPRPTRVIGGAARDAPRRGLESFLTRILVEARKRFGASPTDLAAMIAARSTRICSQPARVSIVECSEAQCIGHARELEQHWQVAAEPWSLERQGEPPPGPVVATLFHYNDIRRRWPKRLGQIRFAAIHPDPAVRHQLDRRLGARKRPARVLLFELAEPLAQSIAADLSRILPPDRYSIRPRVVTNVARELEGRGAEPVLLSPRVWNKLSENQRAHPRAVEIRYVFPEEELDAIGAHFAWMRRRRGAA